MLGLAGAPHCAVMCGAACSTVIRPGQAGTWIGFHLARVAGYSLAGAAAASSVGALSSWSQVTPALRPLWTLAHAAALTLGLWLLWRGRQPAWMENLGRGAQRAAPQGGQWQVMQLMRGPGRAAAAGALWVAWPCGLLQSALVIAALANGAAGGAATMAAFALASAGGLAAAPWLWWRLGGAGTAGAAATWAVRASGLLLAAASAWALGHGLWAPLAAYCGF